MSRTTLRIARAANLLLVGTMAGNELGALLGTHPALRRLEPDTHQAAERAITRRFGQLMPVWMTAAATSGFPILAALPPDAATSRRLTRMSITALTAMVGVTFIGNMPINRRLLDAEELDHATFVELRRRWDRWHLLRNCLNLAGVVLAIASALRDTTPQESR